VSETFPIIKIFVSVISFCISIVSVDGVRSQPKIIQLLAFCFFFCQTFIRLFLVFTVFVVLSYRSGKNNVIKWDNGVIFIIVDVLVSSCLLWDGKHNRPAVISFLKPLSVLFKILLFPIFVIIFGFINLFFYFHFNAFVSRTAYGWEFVQYFIFIDLTSFFVNYLLIVKNELSYIGIAVYYYLEYGQQYKNTAFLVNYFIVPFIVWNIVLITWAVAANYIPKFEKTVKHFTEIQDQDIISREYGSFSIKKFHIMNFFPWM